MFRVPCVLVILTFAGQVWSQQVSPIAIAPAHMPKVATIDPRFVSYNIEMVEVTGGRFWKPYAPFDPTRNAANAAISDKNPRVGASEDRFQYRPPINLANSRLRNLANGLRPAYVRVSGSWANSTYFQDDDNPPMKQPPTGFDNVLTRAEWRGVIEFARAVGRRS